MHLFLSVLLGFIISFISLKVKLLNFSGAVTTFFLTFIIYYLGDIKWTIPILTFFILSSVLSKVRKKINPRVDSFFQKSDERDNIQVLANGGFPGMLVLMNQFFALELFYITYVSAIAIVCSDTWVTEIGTIFNSKTYNIVDFKLVEQGISRAVSLIGFIGAFWGATVISFSSFPWFNNYKFIILVIAFGLFGSTYDSIWGSRLQAKFNCAVCRKTVEKKNHCGTSTLYSKGLRCLDTDGVNFAACTSGGLISFAFASLIL
jgi:uncharacterized protein (TIGR00297 family)